MIVAPLVKSLSVHVSPMKHSNESPTLQQHPITTNLSLASGQQKTAFVMGSLRHEPRHLLYPQRLNSPVPSSSGSSPVSALTVQLKNHTSSTVLTGCVGKEPINNNESMDSGVAGLRDGLTTPHGGSPTSATSSTSSSSHNVLNHPHVLSHQVQPAVAATLPPVHDDSNIHQYIVDRSKNTTYLKGRFLGKVLILTWLKVQSLN